MSGPLRRRSLVGPTPADTLRVPYPQGVGSIEGLDRREPPVTNRIDEVPRFWRMLPAGVVGLFLLTGYVVPPAKILDMWIRARTQPVARTGVEIPVLWDGRRGRLYVASPGRHALILDGAPRVLRAESSAADRLEGFWRTLDLWTAGGAADLSAVLELAGLDLNRAGLARTERSLDGVAHTLGARGEGEPELPQVWFARSPLWPCRVVLPGSLVVTVGPAGPDGWPAWFQLGEGGRIEVMGASEEVPGTPPWLRPDAPPSLGPEGLPTDWRRAFEGLNP